MAKLDVYDLEKKKVGQVDLADEVFAAEVNGHLFYEVVKAKLASDRSGTHAVKNTSLVSGGGKKPWRQKHTGRARQGSTRASQWVGGGKAMGPKPRDYSYDVPRQVRRAALRSALSLRHKEQKLLILEKWEPKEPKTGAAAKVVAKLALGKSTLVVDAGKNQGLARSLRNLANADFLAAEGLNVYDILAHEALVITAETAKSLSGSLAGKAETAKGAES
jgi:large subunit ribosomal protein L4